MKSIPGTTFRLFQSLIAILMVAGLLFPPATVAYAQDEVPPAETETGGEEAPVETETGEEAPAEATEEPEAPVELPPEATVEPPAELTEEPPVEPAPTEVILLEATVEVPAAAEAPAEGETGEETAPVETVAEIVEVLAETNTILVDENGLEIPLVSEEAGEILEAADPFFKSGSIYIGYTDLAGSCASFVTECNKVANPVTDALADVRLTAGTTLYIEGTKTYNESVTIDRSINLQGGSGFSLDGWGNVHYWNGTATINQITLAADLGYINHVYANTVIVNGMAVSTDTLRGNMLHDALTLIAENGTVTLSEGTFEDDFQDFDIDKDGVTLQGAGPTTVIDGNNFGNGIDVNGDGVTVRLLKVVNSAVGIKIDGDDATLDQVVANNNGIGVLVGDPFGWGNITEDTNMTNMMLVGNQIGLVAEPNTVDVTIHNSNIFGNSMFGVFNKSFDILDATGNYWGSPLGPTDCWMDQFYLPQCGPTKGDKAFANTDYYFIYFDHIWPYYHFGVRFLNVLTGFFITTPCDDGDPTTVDTLNKDGTCSHVTKSCDDGDPRTVDTLNKDGTCSNVLKSCDDGDPATVDTLNPDGSCSHVSTGGGGPTITGGGPGAVLLAVPLGVGGLIPVTGGEPRLIAAGAGHTCAVTPEGGAQCWGNNNFGQLGDGTNNASNIPVDVLGIEGAISIVAGGNHTCALESDGSVWCWGENDRGQVGDGTSNNSSVPVKVLDGAVDVTAGLDYSCAVMGNGEVMCWGNNDKGQLADGTTINRNRPTIASLIMGVSGLTAGQFTNCGLTEEGKVACWSNGQGWDAAELTAPSTFVMVNRFTSGMVALDETGVPIEWDFADQPKASSLKGATFGDGGLANVCVLKDDGTVLCWGSNENGELGNATNIVSSSPAPVSGLNGAYALAVGEHHSCAMMESGEIECWGLNTDGQLGNGSNDSSNTPVVVK